MQKKSTTPVTIQVPRDALASSVMSGVAYGIRYWARNVVAVIPDEVIAALTDEQREELQAWGRVPFAAITPGCRVELVEHGGCDDVVERHFDHGTLASAIGTIAEKHRHVFAELLDGGDASSGDLLIQYAALGESVYG